MIKMLGHEFEEYGVILSWAGLSYRQEDIWLTVGPTPVGKYWVLMASVSPAQMPEFLKEILLLTAGQDVCFRLIAHQGLHYQLNGSMMLRPGNNGLQVYEPARGLTFYIKSSDQAARLASLLGRLAVRYQGPQLPGARRLDRVWYAGKVEVSGFLSPTEVAPKFWRWSSHPFASCRQQDFFPVRQRLILGQFIPISVIKTGAKGTVYKAINIKGLSLTWCLVKVANAFALEDFNGRDMRDRLEWQAQVLHDLQGVIKVPAVIAFQRIKAYAVLAMDWMEGVALPLAVADLIGGRRWPELELEARRKIIGYYLQALEITSTLHGKGYLHRDLSAANFMVSEEGQLYLIDFELTYSTTYRRPWPPFMVGSPGYMTANQMQLGEPVAGDDLHALGALLLFLTTAVEPDAFFEKHGQDWLQAYRQATGSVLLTDILKRTLADGTNLSNGTERLKRDMQAYLGIHQPSPLSVI